MEGPQNLDPVNEAFLATAQGYDIAEDGFFDFLDQGLIGGVNAMTVADPSFDAASAFAMTVADPSYDAASAFSMTVADPSYDAASAFSMTVADPSIDAASAFYQNTFDCYPDNSNVLLDPHCTSVNESVQTVSPTLAPCSWHGCVDVSEASVDLADASTLSYIPQQAVHEESICPLDLHGWPILPQLRVVEALPTLGWCPDSTQPTNHQGDVDMYAGQPPSDADQVHSDAGQVPSVAGQVPSDAGQDLSYDAQVPSDDDTTQTTDLATSAGPHIDGNQEVSVGSDQFYLQQGLFMCASCRRQFLHRWTLERHVRKGESDWIELRNRLINFSRMAEEADTAANWVVMSAYNTPHWLKRFNEMHTSWYHAIESFYLDSQCEREWESLELQNIITTSAITSRIRYMLSVMDRCGGNKCDRMNSCYYNQHGDIFVGIIRFVSIVRGRNLE